MQTKHSPREQEYRKQGRNKDRQKGHSHTGTHMNTHSDYYTTAPLSVSGSLEGRTGAGRSLINECYWVVESLCPHSPSCHQRTQWLHQFVAIITSIGKNGGRRGVKY